MVVHGLNAVWCDFEAVRRVIAQDGTAVEVVAVSVFVGSIGDIMVFVYQLRVV